jgi:TorA maturation chaperone TorD
MTDPVNDMHPVPGQGEVYGFLAGLFASNLEGEALQGLLAQADRIPGSGLVGPAAELLEQLRAESDREGLEARLAREHTRLFRGVREGYGPPPPYESLWREGQLMGDGTIDVAKAYIQTGFRPDPRWGPCDHLVDELHFLASLANAEGQAAEAEDHEEARWLGDRRRAFLKDHVLAWVPEYCAVLEKDAREPYYRALARTTSWLLAEERSWLDTGNVREQE